MILFGCWCGGFGHSFCGVPFDLGMVLVASVVAFLSLGISRVGFLITFFGFCCFSACSSVDISIANPVGLLGKQNKPSYIRSDVVIICLVVFGIGCAAVVLMCGANNNFVR